jgi:chemotaxis protein methyltransferase CheR
MSESLLLASTPPLSDRAFHDLRSIVYDQAGISLNDSKKALVTGRLWKRLRALSLGSFEEYVARVRADEPELVRMLDAISTNETHFFREPSQFRFLAEELLPAWQADGNRRSIRIWSAGCSTGEEPYSIAMTLLANLRQRECWTIEVIASDISTRVLDHASNATWPAERIEEIPSEYRRFMLKGIRSQDGRMRAAPALRSLIAFERINLHERLPFPAASFDAIFCRNVLIYFDKESRRRALERMLPLLAPGGHFFVGHAETLGGTPLAPVASMVYRR